MAKPKTPKGEERQPLPLNVSDETIEFTVKVSASQAGLIDLLLNQSIKLRVEKIERIKTEKSELDDIYDDDKDMNVTSTGTQSSWAARGVG
jgi:hypothetical protein